MVHPVRYGIGQVNLQSAGSSIHGYDSGLAFCRGQAIEKQG